MKYKILYIIILFLISDIFGSKQDLEKFYIDFTSSISCNFNYQDYKNIIKFKKKNIKNHIVIIKKLYKKNNFLQKKNHYSKITIIPKIIHQIWLGSPLPEKYKKWQESWKKFHPDWEYKLWTDEDVNKMKLLNRKLYNKIKNYGEKSDILRYEILYQFGGLYVDTDFECYKSFDFLHHTYEFYIGMATINRNIFCNALIGTIPKHPIIKYCIDTLELKNQKKNILKRSGPIFFGDCIIESIKSNAFDLSKIIILPPTYFYALPSKKFEYKINEFIQPHSLAIHHWAESWIDIPNLRS